MNNLPKLDLNFDSLLKQGFAVIDVRFRDYDITKEPYLFVITRVENSKETFYFDMIKKYTSLELKEKDIYALWANILKHKLDISKNLKRDISIKVAALDYIETNDYKQNNNK